MDQILPAELSNLELEALGQIAVHPAARHVPHSFSTGLPPCSSGRQSCFLDQVASPVQFAYLSIEVSYRVGDARKAPQKSTHFETPILTLQLRGTMAPSVGHRGALKVQIKPLQ